MTIKRTKVAPVALRIYKKNVFEKIDFPGAIIGADMAEITCRLCKLAIPNFCFLRLGLP